MKTHVHIRHFFIPLLVLGLLCSCGSHPHRRGWGQDITLLPGWQKIGSAAWDAAFSPETWAPLTAAFVLQIDDMDGRISEWASDNTPLFGSNEDADTASDYLIDAAGASYLATAFATDSGNDLMECTLSKARGLAMGAAAIGLTVGATKVIKNTADRTRPNGAGDESFVSGHTSSAAGFATLARRNLTYINLSKGAKKILGAGFSGLAALTGWARVEAKEHYPSDVLAGYALGHFICSFFNDAFLAGDDAQTVQVVISPSKQGVLLGVSLAY